LIGYFLNFNSRFSYKDLDNNGLSDVSLEWHIVIEISVRKEYPHYHSCTDYIVEAQFKKNTFTLLTKKYTPPIFQ